MTITGVPTRFRDIIRKYVPPWLSDRPTSGLTSGFRYVWSMVAPLDAALDVLVQGLRAAYPGLGTDTALPLISRTRGIIRGQGETDEDFGAYLRTWLDQWRAAGSALAIASAIQHYLANHPKVRIVTRSGFWVTLDTDGSVETYSGTWDWDSVSNPERASWWSEIWVIVYPSQWSTAGSFLANDGSLWGEDGLGIGHDVNRVEHDAITGLVAQWKAAHTRVRAIVWTTDANLFDPETPASLPDGTWGTWSRNVAGSQVASGRNLSTCRYWEPR